MKEDVVKQLQAQAGEAQETIDAGSAAPDAFPLMMAAEILELLSTASISTQGRSLEIVVGGAVKGSVLRS